MHIKNKIRVSFAFFLTIISFCAYSQSNVFKVTLDAGHGGHDRGAIVKGVEEAQVTLAVAKELKKRLE